MCGADSSGTSGPGESGGNELSACPMVREAVRPLPFRLSLKEASQNAPHTKETVTVGMKLVFVRQATL